MKAIPENTAVFEMDGPMFFAASEKFADISITAGTKVIILRMRSVNDLDISARHTLDDIFDRCKDAGITLILSHVNEKPMAAMKKAGFYDKVGEENFLPNITAALEYAGTIEK